MLRVPYSAHASTVEDLKSALVGHVLIDITAPLQPYRLAGPSSSVEAQAILGNATPVVAAIQTFTVSKPDRLGYLKAKCAFSVLN